MPIAAHQLPENPPQPARKRKKGSRASDKIILFRRTLVIFIIKYSLESGFGQTQECQMPNGLR